MASQYIVVRAGDLFKGEFLNIGVFTYEVDPESTQVYSHFISNFERIYAALGWGKDIILEAIAEHAGKIDTKEKMEDFLKDCNSPWSSLIFTEPRASLESAKELSEWVIKTFLTE